MKIIETALAKLHGATQVKFLQITNVKVGLMSSCYSDVHVTIVTWLNQKPFLKRCLFPLSSSIERKDRKSFKTHLGLPPMSWSYGERKVVTKRVQSHGFSRNNVFVILAQGWNSYLFALPTTDWHPSKLRLI